MSNDRIPSEESLSAECVGNDDECPDLCWMQKRAYDRFAEIDHEEQDEQTWLDKLRRFQHSLLPLQSKKIIASENAVKCNL